MPRSIRTTRAAVLAVAIFALGLVTFGASASAKTGPTVTLTQVTFSSSPSLGTAYCEVTWHLTVTGVSGSKPWGAFSSINPDDLGESSVFVGDFTHVDDGVAESITDTVNGFELNNGNPHTYQVTLYNTKNQLVATSSMVTADSSC